MILLVFKNPDLLFTDALPPEFRFRERQIQKLDTYVFNAIGQSIPASNIAVFGGSGSGKTLTVRYLCEQKAKNCSYYLNVGEYANLLEALQSFHAKLFDKPAKRGVSKGELINNILDELYKRHGKQNPVIFVLDEFDKYLNTRIGTEDRGMVLYPLLRANYSRPGFWFNVVLIGNDAFLFEKFNDAIRSSFGHLTELFPCYTQDELLEILIERASLALQPNAVSKQRLARIAEWVAEEGNGNARQAIQVLGEAARRAVTKIENDDVEEAIKDVEQKTFNKEIQCFDIHCLVLLLSTIKIYRKDGGSYSPRVYATYKKTLETACYKIILSEKQAQRRLFELEKKGFIHASKRYDLPGQPLFFLPKPVEGLDLIEKLLREQTESKYPLLNEHLDSFVENNKQQKLKGEDNA